MRLAIITVLFFFSGLSLCATHKTNVTGIWSTKEPGSKEPQIHIKVYKQNERIYGKIIRLLYIKNPPPAIIPANGKEERRPLLGTTILRDLRRIDDSWEDGVLLDPNSGSEYRCRIWRVGGHLKVRGYQFIFHKTLTWFPTSDTAQLNSRTQTIAKGGR